jgi:hypothetical protein
MFLQNVKMEYDSCPISTYVYLVSDSGNISEIVSTECALLYVPYPCSRPIKDIGNVNEL